MKNPLPLKNRLKDFFTILTFTYAALHLFIITSLDLLDLSTYLFVLIPIIIPFFYIVSVQKKKLNETVEQLNQALHKEKDTNQTLEAIIEDLPLSVAFLDSSGKVKKWNRGSEEIFGWTKKEVFDQPHPNAFLQKQLENVLKDETSICLEEQCVKKDGSTIDIHIFSAPIRNDAGHAVGAIGIAEDISQRKRLAAALMEAESKFHTLVEKTLIGVSIIQDNKFKYVNPRFSEIFGYSQDELYEKDVLDLVAAEDRFIVQENIHKRITGEIKNIRYQVRGLKKDNHIIDLEIYGSQMIYRGKSAVITTLLDITERKQAEKSLKKSEERFALFIKHIPGVVFIKDSNGRYIFVNELFERTHKMKLSEWYGKTDNEVWPREFAAQFIVNDHVVHQTGKCLKTIEVAPKDGAAHYWLVYKFPIINTDGDMMVAGIAIDITDNKRSEEALRDSEERFRSAFDYAAIGMTLADKEGKLIKMNDSFCKMIGYSEQELLEKPFQDITHPDDLDSNLESIRKLLAGDIKHFQIEKRYIHKHGQIIWGIVTVSLVRDGEGKPLYFITQIQDVTKRKEAEELLRKSEKLSAVGQLAAGVAHEVRNPLTVVKGFVQLLQSTEKKNEEFIRLILSEVERIESIISEFLVLAKPQMEKFKIEDIRKILQHVIALVETNAILNNINIYLECEEDIPFIECDQNKLKQVFINILKNAIEAMPGGGNIQIIVKKKQEDAVQISFLDQGCGIPEERISKLGEPFYSNKEKGTGLGLMISYKIIEEHNGRIHVQSIVGQGTTFHVILPVKKLSHTSKV